MFDDDDDDDDDDRAPGPFNEWSWVPKAVNQWQVLLSLAAAPWVVQASAASSRFCLKRELHLYDSRRHYTAARCSVMETLWTIGVDGAMSFSVILQMRKSRKKRTPHMYKDSVDKISQKKKDVWHALTCVGMCAALSVQGCNREQL